MVACLVNSPDQCRNASSVFPDLMMYQEGCGQVWKAGLGRTRMDAGGYGGRHRSPSKPLTACLAVATRGSSRLLPLPSPWSFSTSGEGTQGWCPREIHLVGQAKWSLGPGSSDFSWKFSQALPVLAYFWLLWLDSCLSNQTCPAAPGQGPPAKTRQEQGQVGDGRKARERPSWDDDRELPGSLWGAWVPAQRPSVWQSPTSSRGRWDHHFCRQGQDTREVTKPRVHRGEWRDLIQSHG